MVRVVALLALVCGAAAVFEASSTPFGASVLAELESKIAQGQPLDELTAILADIRQRLQEAGTADEEAQKADDLYCKNRGEKLLDDIRLENSQISSINASINQDKAVVAAMEIEIAKEEEIIATLTRKIAANEAEQKEREDEREVQIQQFQQGTKDVDICVKAIDDIEALGGLAALRDRQSDSAADYQKGVTALLQSLSTRVSHPQVLNLVQLGALTAVTIPAGDVTRLDALLAQLKSDLLKYKKDITSDDLNLSQLYAQTMADLRKTKADDEKARAQSLNRKQDATTKKDSANSRITINKIELEEAIESRDDIQTVYDNLQTDCAARKAAHESRVVERSEEEDTIDAIQKILEEKLGKHFDNDHLMNNVTTSVGATEEGRSYKE